MMLSDHHALLRIQTDWACDRCGFQVRTMHFQVRGVKLRAARTHWGTIRRSYAKDAAACPNCNANGEQGWGHSFQARTDAHCTPDCVRGSETGPCTCRCNGRFHAAVTTGRGVGLTHGAQEPLIHDPSRASV